MAGGHVLKGRGEREEGGLGGQRQTNSRPPPLQAVFVGNGLMAILAGLIANYLVTDMKLGPVAPFDASAVVLLIGGAVILSTWGRWRQACRAVRWGRWSSECISAPLPSPRPFSLLPSAGENYGDSKHQHSLGHQFKMAGAAIMGGKCNPWL